MQDTILRRRVSIFLQGARENEENLEILCGIAGDFVRFSKTRAKLDEQSIREMLIDFIGSLAELMPIVVFAIDGSGEVEKRNINRDHAVFSKLF
ncbi:hypothetical protein [Pedobacter mucosus]|uniref:hypothetical protein n=1 Tax=Pedobacter mucosus TaxID=2895286 RepID=UPI001EE3BD7B|nr:hypothetical protein [Pedobacter mucosus]UKT64764.1 hypothetical protein LOK61_03065 [Pedobacter mucosus]